MHNATFTPSPDTAKLATFSAAQLTTLVQSQAQTIAALKHQLEWFKRQVFGHKSERFAPELDPTQPHLGEVLPVPITLPESRKSVPAHTRRVPATDLASAQTVPFFDETRVPMEEYKET